MDAVIEYLTQNMDYISQNQRAEVSAAPGGSFDDAMFESRFTEGLGGDIY